MFGGGSGYAGQKKLLYEQAPKAKDFTQKKGSRYRKLTEAERSVNRYKSKIRSRVEHVFGVMKCQFGFTKVRYRGLDKNAQCVFTKCALVNLVLAKKTLLATYYLGSSKRYCALLKKRSDEFLISLNTC